MQWAVLYHTEEPFDEVVELLKHHGYSPEVFCDPHCRELYVPGCQPNSTKCRPHFYIAVPREQRLNAGRIVNDWTRKIQQEHTNLKRCTFGKAVMACLYSLVIFAVCYVLHPEFLDAKDYNNIAAIIFIGAIVWTGIFIFLISKKPPAQEDQRDFTR